MKKNFGAIYLSIITVCILLLNLSNLIDYINTGYKGSTFSNICFIAGAVCIIIAWILYFVDKKKNRK